MDKWIPGWSGLNWKGKAAKVQQYYDQGKSEFSAFEKMAMVGVGLKVFEVPLVWIIILTPFIAIGAVLAYAVIGYVWVKRGWYRQKQEISTLDSWSPMGNLQWRLLVGIAHALNVSVKAQDLTTAPPEVRELCLSLKRDLEKV